MQQREVRAYLLDIVLACDAVSRYARGKSLEDYLGDDQLRSSIERQVFICGEAVVKVRSQEPLAVHTLGDVDGIVTVRNILAHLYFAVRNEKVWEIVEVHAPRLRIAAQQWFDELSGKQA